MFSAPNYGYHCNRDAPLLAVPLWHHATWSGLQLVSQGVAIHAQQSLYA